MECFLYVSVFVMIFLYFIQIIQTSPVSCSCGVFLSGQLTSGMSKIPKEDPIIETSYPMTESTCTQKACTKKCLEQLYKLRKQASTIPNIICLAAINKQVNREKAHLLVKYCGSEWKDTHLAGGKEYCCNVGVSYKC